jgi:hypothetical protein
VLTDQTVLIKHLAETDPKQTNKHPDKTRKRRLADAVWSKGLIVFTMTQTNQLFNFA